MRPRCKKELTCITCNLEQNSNILNITFNNFSTVYTQQHAINIINFGCSSTSGGNLINEM